jgi:hypothetical protein
VTDSFENSEGTCARSSAERWVNAGSSKYVNKDKTYITHPDWHSHSWLSADELESAFRDDTGPDYKATLAAMRSFEKDGYQARLVFWFDN